MFTRTGHPAPRAWEASTSHKPPLTLLCARRAAIDVRADRRRRRLKGSRTRGLEGSRARGCSDETVMPHGSRRQSSGAEAAEARGTRPAEARCLGNGQSDRESTGARQSRRQRHRRQRACCTRSKYFDACTDRSLPHLLLSSPLLSLSLSNAVIRLCCVINVQLHAMHARRVAPTQNAPRYDASWNEHRVGGLSYVRIILSPPASSAA